MMQRIKTERVNTLAIIVLNLWTIYLLTSLDFSAADPAVPAPKPIFENLNATWPSASEIRAASMDRFMDHFYVLKSNPKNDLFQPMQYHFRPTVFIATSNPQPIFMLESESSMGQLNYQTKTPTERMIRKLLREILGSPTIGCTSHRGDGLVLDVGANEGFYALLASAYGCRALSFEPQPRCVAWISWAVAMNRFKHPVKVVNQVVSKDPLSFQVPVNTCSGMQNYGTSDPPNPGDLTTVSSVSLDQVINENDADVLVLHMDVEGAEINVLESGMQHIRTRRVKNIIFEMNPSRWAKYGHSIAYGLSVLETLHTAGYVCRDLNTIQTPVQSLPLVKSFKVLPPLPKFETDMWCTCMPSLTTVSEVADEIPNDSTSPGWITVNPGEGP
jgi:FkbM family methyltransferase